MSLLRPLDPAFPIQRQIAVDAAPVVLMNVFTLDKADETAFLEVWRNDAEFMKRQPGFISTQLHRAIGESPTYLNYAVWESTAAFRAAVTHPEFTAKLSAYPASVSQGLERRQGLNATRAHPFFVREERQGVIPYRERSGSRLAPLWLARNDGQSASAIRQCRDVMH